jgi:hypothetical protein
MSKATKSAFRLRCLVAVLAPFLAIVFYPRANWLFAFVLVGIAVLLLNHYLAKDPTPQELADYIERILTGKYSGMEVDEFEHRRIRDPQLEQFWRRSMKVSPHPCPEEWVGLDEERKDRLREVIRELRALGETRDAERSAHKKRPAI